MKFIKERFFDFAIFDEAHNIAPASKTYSYILDVQTHYRENGIF